MGELKLTTNYAPVNKGYGERREGTMWFICNVYFNPANGARAERPGDGVHVCVSVHSRVKSQSDFTLNYLRM